MGFGFQMISGEWGTYSVMIAVFSIIVAIIIYMSSKVFQDPKLEQNAKSEIIFASSTVILVMFIVLVLPIAEDMSVNIVNGLYDQSVITPHLDIGVIDVANEQINNQVKCGVNIINGLYVADVFTEMVGSIVMEIGMSELATGFSMKFISERIANISQSITFYLIIYKVIFNILIFLKYFGMFLFPFGVLLRAFPPTRGGGAFLMATSIGLYFIFPLSYILSEAMIENTNQGSQICSMSSLPTNQFCDTNTDGKVVCHSAGMTSITKLYTTINSEDANKNIIMKFIDEAKDKVNNFIMSACFLPLFAMTITMSFILSTSSLFGATIPEVGKGLIKLI